MSENNENIFIIMHAFAELTREEKDYVKKLMELDETDEDFFLEKGDKCQLPESVAMFIKEYGEWKARQKK